MALTTAPKVFGSHAQFFIDGGSFTVPQAGICSRTAKPGATDVGWVDLGVIEDFAVSPIEGDTIEIFKASPGVVRKYDEIQTKIKQKGSFKAKEFSPLVLQTLFRTANLTSASTQFNPHEGLIVKGWLKCEIYDHSDTLALVGDVWVILRISGDVNFGGGLCEATFEFEILYSTLNTGSIYPA